MFEALGGVEKYIKKGTRVVLKPNLVMKRRPEEAATTHPAIVRELSKILMDAGATVLIAESPGGLYTHGRLASVYRGCGIAKAAEESGAKLNYDLDETEVDNPSGKYLKRVRVIKPVADADVIINLPKLKSHGQMVYTGAVKNMFGAIAGPLKAEYHFRMSDYDEFANALIDIFLSVKPTLNIMDAVTGMDGAGPTAGDPKEIGLIIAGEDGFEVDLAALNIVRADPMDVPIMRQAYARGLCQKDISRIDFSGSGADLDTVRVDGFRMPGSDFTKTLRFFDRGIMKHLVKVMEPRPVFRHSMCIGCSECARSCPAKVIEMKDGKPAVDLKKCIRCFCCQELCPAKAVYIRRNFVMDFLTRK